MWFEQLANIYQLTIKRGAHNGIEGIALFNTNSTHRYFLEKRWGQGGEIFTAVMMNPSRAAHNQTDPTVDQLIAVAKDHGYNALYVVNVASIIEGTSSNLKKAHFTYEPINWSFISRALTESNAVFLGWGVKGQLGTEEHQKSNASLVNAFESVLSKIYCYEVIQSKNKKFTNKPLYYVPHPRPRKEKYCNVPIRRITERELLQLFYR